MSSRYAVVWDESVLGYDLGEHHPLHPVRLDLTMRLSRSLGLFDGIDVVPPDPAAEEDLLRVHSREFLDAVDAAPTAYRDVGHGLGTTTTRSSSGCMRRPRWWQADRSRRPSRSCPVARTAR